MSDDKLEPIVFLLPADLRGREFAVAFDKHIEDIKSMFAVDMETIKLKPKTGIELMLDGESYFDSLRGCTFTPRAIKEYKP